MMMAYEIRHYDGINNTPAFALAMRAHVELLEKGFSDPVQMVSWNDRAVVCFDGNEPIGVITYAHTDHAKQANIMFGYVLAPWRRRGCYRLMWDALVAKSKELGCVEIMGNTSVNNHELRAVAKALGREEIAIILRYKLT